MQIVQLPLRTVRRKQSIYCQGSAGTELLLVCEGLIKVVTELEPGVRALDLAGPGDLLGEDALTGSQRGSSATAITRARVREIPVSLIDQLLASNVEFSYALLGHLSRRVGMTRELNAALGGTPTTVRAAHHIATLAIRLGVRQPNGIMVHHGLTQCELSDLVGSTRETLNRALHELAGRQWLELGTRSFLVTNLSELMSLGRVGPLGRLNLVAFGQG